MRRSQGRRLSIEEVHRIKGLLKDTDLSLQDISIRMQCTKGAIRNINEKCQIRKYRGRRSCWHVSGVSVIFLTLFSILATPDAYADALGLSSIGFSNIQIKPTTGSVIFGSWTSDGFAQAQNNLGDLNHQFISNSGTATASTAVTYANASGGANAGALSGSASSGVNLTGVTTPSFGNSVGQGTLENVFMLTGGTGSTNVAFSALVAGLLQVKGDPSAIEESTETIFNLSLNGDSLLFFDSMLSGGPNFNATTPFSQSLSNTLSLNFNTPYFLMIQADSESRAITSVVPEPATLPTMLFGLVLLLGAARTKIYNRPK